MRERKEEEIKTGDREKESQEKDKTRERKREESEGEKGFQRCPNENVVECRETIRGTCEKIAPKEKGEKEGEKNNFEQR